MRNNCVHSKSSIHAASYMFQQVSFRITWVSKAATQIRVGCHKKEAHLPQALIIVCPRVPRLNIGRNDDATGVPQPHPRELEPSKLSCATLAISLAARHFDQRREQFRFTGSGADKRECLASIACVQHVYAAKSWPSFASISTCHLNSRNAAAWWTLASGMSMPGSLRSIRSHPSWHTRSPLERNKSRKSPLPRPRKKTMNAVLVRLPLEPKCEHSLVHFKMTHPKPAKFKAWI